MHWMLIKPRSLLLQSIGNVTAELELQRLQQEQLRRQEMVRRGQHMYPGPPLALLPLLEQMRPQQQGPNVSNIIFNTLLYIQRYPHIIYKSTNKHPKNI